MFRRFIFTGLVLLSSTVFAADSPAWTRAAVERGPMSVEEAKAFMLKLARHAVEYHMKKAEGSAQRGMMYEYLWWKNRGRPNQFIEGEALDTMHDGAWFACAMANAYRATHDPYYKGVLVKWQLPFYLKMLNESGKLFNNDQIDVRDDAKDLWKNSKEWLLQGREDGFVPYWWDDGGSVSLDMVAKKTERPGYPCTNDYKGKPNPDFKLSGWSHGSSNHLAQDLAIMLIQGWLVCSASPDAADQRTAEQCALAAKHLQECRTRHGAGNIPVVVAACALTNRDAEMMKRVDAWQKETPALLQNHYTKSVRDFKPGQKISMPGFADDQLYSYFSGVSRNRAMTRPLALKLTFDSYTQPILWQIYSDDAPVPPGMNRFDLTSLNFVDGKPEHVRSQRKGPRGSPLPSGSRMGPQNMIVCALALQALAKGGDYSTVPGQITEAVKGLPGADKNPDIQAWLEREAGGGLRTWEAVFAEYGYIPTGIGCQSVSAGSVRDEYSDTGGYAHLISAAAQWVLYREGKTDWEHW
jgi:hypothetical protein